MIFLITHRTVFFLCLVITLFSCKEDAPNNYEWNTIEVTATAYNSLAYQTDNNPFITAFGDSLKPGMRYIAVSRDLLKQGLKHNTLVKVEGLNGTYLVKDKMHYRWRNKIDIYMGTDVKAAKKWGRRKISISYRIEKLKDTLQD
jgi:3D (Asp-Asp-Asp) domain-containing protein